MKLDLKCYYQQILILTFRQGGWNCVKESISLQFLRVTIEI